MDSATCRFKTPNVVKSVERNRSKSLTFPRSGSSKNSLKIKITKEGVFRYPGLRPVMVSRTMGGFTINIIDTPGLVEAGYVNHQALELIKGSVALLFWNLSSFIGVDDIFFHKLFIDVYLWASVEIVNYDKNQFHSSTGLQDFAIAVVYAENSGRCSKNDKDEKALPNGEAWIPNLVKAITDVATNQRKAIHVDKKMVDGSYSDDKGKKLIPLIIGVQYLIVKMIQGAIRNDIKTSGKPL
ncbi:unnamed protein product [Arabidopsis halleri]